MPTIESLHVYPIKGCGGVDYTGRDEVRVTQNGLAHDRRFMVVDSENRFISQRRFGQLAVVRTAIDARGVVATAEGMGELKIGFDQRKRETPENRVDVEMFDILPKVYGYDVGPEAGEWFSDYLKTPDLRVLATPSRGGRQVNPRYQLRGASNRVGFADGFSALLTSTASLDALNEQLGSEHAVPMNRFRPNIVIDGIDLKPFTEDTWREIQVAGLSMFVVRACGRCQVIDVDQATGEKARGVLQTLSTFRRGKDLTRPEPNKRREALFGQNLNMDYVPGAAIRVGDYARVAKRGAPNIKLDPPKTA